MENAWACLTAYASPVIEVAVSVVSAAGTGGRLIGTRDGSRQDHYMTGGQWYFSWRYAFRANQPEKSQLIQTFVGCPPGIRTPIDRFRADCPTIERGGNRLPEPQMVFAGCLLECTRWGR